MDIETLEDLFAAELADIYSAEEQLTKALKKMAKKANHEKLADGFRTHLKETEDQIERLDKVIEICGLDIPDETCEAMEGLIKEGEEMAEKIEDPYVLDAALIVSAQKVEHYEIASYGSLCALARNIGVDEQAIQLLEETLEEEKATDQKLTELAEDEGINAEAGREAA